jgi:biopolymer transport protein ExbB/TolQ
MESEEAAAQGFSLIETFTRLASLGAEWVMWLMLALAALVVIIAVERLYLFLSTRIDVMKLARGLLSSNGSEHTHA